MSAIESTWLQFWQQLTTAFQDLYYQIQHILPEARMLTGHSSNASFPFRAYASYSVHNSEHSIDVSVDCRTVTPFLHISADVAQDTGVILSDFGSRRIAIGSLSLGRELLPIFNDIEEYIRVQDNTITAALILLSKGQS